MEYVELTDIKIGGGKIEYTYTAPARLRKYLRQNNTLYVEYPEDCDLRTLPTSVLTIPFVSCFLSVTMLLKIGVKVNELDRDYYESIPRIRAAYKRMFPYLDLCFDVIAKTTYENRYESAKRPSLFFTGGLDATSALVEKADEHPLLVNIWGGDISTADNASHKELEDYLNRVSHDMNTDYVFIKSNCRELFNEQKVTRLLATKILPWQNHGWWASIAHILSMSALMAPLAYIFRIGHHYVASSYDAKSKTFDANNQTLLDAIKFSSCNLVPVDSDLERSGKARKIIKFCNENDMRFELKVCWYRQGGKNCSHCEKCYRTIMEICSNHGDPNLFGFTVTDKTFLEMQAYLKSNYVNKGYWNPIRKNFRKEANYWKGKPEFAWILDMNFNRPKAIINKAIYVINKFI